MPVLNPQRAYGERYFERKRGRRTRCRRTSCGGAGGAWRRGAAAPVPGAAAAEAGVPTPEPSTPSPRPTRNGSAACRRMKTIATGALLLMATVFVLAKWAQHEGAGALDAATSRPPPRRAWWARSPTGSR